MSSAPPTKWSCMDHWVTETPQGPQPPSFNRAHMDRYVEVEPVTDDKIKFMADLWYRVGELTLEHGMKTTCHFEFWGAIRTREHLDTFFAHTDPA